MSLSALLTGWFVACGDDDENPPGVAGSGGEDAQAASGGSGGTMGGSGNATGGTTGESGDATGGADASAGTGGAGGGQGGTGGAQGGAGGAQGGAGGGQGGSSGADGSAGGPEDGGAAGMGGSSGATAIDDCPGPVDSALAQALAAGGAVDAQMKWLYPYDKTVFPRGLAAPVLQWSPATGAAPSAVFVRLHTQNFEYRGCFGALDPARLQLPQQVWDQAATAASGAATPLVAELTTAVNGVVSGPIVQTWTIAPGNLQGVVFYNTYDSPQIGNNGGVMRLVLGQTAMPYLTISGLAPFGPCVSCHAVSANGQRMVAATQQYPNISFTSASYAVTASANPPQITALDEAGFGGVFPDGSRVMTMGSPASTANPFPFGPGNVPGMVGPRLSRLFDMATGQQLSPTGWTVQYAKMPMFSPDGTKIVFNHHEASDGHSLATMDFSLPTNTFSNLVPIYQHAQLFPGWPFFTPNNQGVVFALGDSADYVGAHPLRPIVARSELYYVDIATKQAVRLSRAGGFEGSQLYLPYPGRDERYDFFPSLSPVAAGGYFWVFFTSRRNYGNAVVTATADVASAKKIWVAAIDIDPPAGSDPSHPAFYLPGQEEASGNFHPFAALAP